MSNGEDESTNIGDRAPDPSAESPEPPAAEGAVTLAGFWDGRGRLYFTPDHSSYAEFLPEAVRRFGDVTPGQIPFLGKEGTWVELEPTATVEIVRTGPPEADDEFRPEIRLRSVVSRLGDDVARSRYGCGTGRYCEPAPPWPGLDIPYL